MHRRKLAVAAAVLIPVALTGCVRRAGRNSNCQWPGDPVPKTLAPNQRGYAGHMRGDAEFAEELAIEYMDAHYGPRSGNFESQEATNQALNGCLGELIGQIGKSHDIPPGEVAGFLGLRSIAIDAAVILPFVALYVFLAGRLARALRRRYPPDDGWITALVMILLASLAFGAAGMAVGEQWSTLMENLRVGTGHLSYRVARLPWVRHESDFFILYLMLFWLAAGSVWLRGRPRRAG